MSKKFDQSEQLKTREKAAHKKKNKGIIGLRLVLIIISICFVFSGMSFGYYFGYEILNDTA